MHIGLRADGGANGPEVNARDWEIASLPDAHAGAPVLNNEVVVGNIAREAGQRTAGGFAGL